MDDPSKKVYRVLRDMARTQQVLNGTEWRIPQLPKHKDLAERAMVQEVEVAEAIANLISEDIAEREYPGLVVKDVQRFKSLCF